MNSLKTNYDAIVIGSGPAGQNAAITSAGLGAKTLIIERELAVGGACVQYGTIPSKTLRETAVTLSSFKLRSGNVYDISAREDLQIESLMTRLRQVVTAHQSITKRYLDFAGVTSIHGHAKFLSPTELSIRNTKGDTNVVRGDRIFIATGSRPRNPPDFPVDHEHILDSDSILSMTYLPQSLVVFGGGVIACEYAATFACLGVRVVLVDRNPKPLGFLDDELVQVFLDRFRANGGTFLGNQSVSSVVWDGASKVVTTFRDGEKLECDKGLVALGRIANTDNLNLPDAGLHVTDRGLIKVNDEFMTAEPSIYAVGDAIGPPSLASASVHQGRKAARCAFGEVATPDCDSETPMGIYTIPEIASVGMDEPTSRKNGRKVLVGRADFLDLARGQIMASAGGLLKLIADEQGQKVLGVQIAGDGATELIHVGQMVIFAKMTIDQLAVVNFNFPTLAESLRLAALDVVSQRPQSPSQSKQPELDGDDRGQLEEIACV